MGIFQNKQKPKAVTVTTEVEETQECKLSVSVFIKKIFRINVFYEEEAFLYKYY